MSSVPTKQIDGDVAVGHDVTIGGKAIVRGSLTIGHDLRIEGWLDARNIRGPQKGLFINKDQLLECYPHPREGWWALVGDTLPAELWIALPGRWIRMLDDDGSPTLTGTPTVDDLKCRQELERLSGEMDSVKALAEADSAAIAGLRAQTDASAAAARAATPRTVDISELDAQAHEMGLYVMDGTAPAHSHFTVTDGAHIVGTLDVFSDSMRHVLTQVIETHLRIVDGIMTTAHTDSQISRHYRSYNLTSTNLGVDTGKWTLWRECVPETAVLAARMAEDSASMAAAAQVRADRAAAKAISLEDIDTMGCASAAAMRQLVVCDGAADNHTRWMVFHGTWNVGTLDLLSDPSGDVLTQIFETHYVFEGGEMTGRVAASSIRRHYRTYSYNSAVLAAGWSAWRQCTPTADEVAALKIKAQSAQDTAAQNSAAIDRISGEVEDISGMAVRLKASVDGMRTDMETMGQEMAAVQKTADAAYGRIANEISPMMTLLDTRQGQLESNVDDYRAVFGSQISHMSQNFSALSGRMTDAETDIAALKAGGGSGGGCGCDHRYLLRGDGAAIAEEIFGLGGAGDEPSGDELTTDEARQMVEDVFGASGAMEPAGEDMTEDEARGIVGSLFG